MFGGVGDDVGLGGGFLGIGADLLADGGELLAGVGDLLSVFGDGDDHLHEIGLHLVHRRGKVADLILGAHGDFFPGQIAVGDALSHFPHFLHRPGDQAADEHRQNHADRHGPTNTPMTHQSCGRINFRAEFVCFIGAIIVKVDISFDSTRSIFRKLSFCAVIANSIAAAGFPWLGHLIEFSLALAIICVRRDDGASISLPLPVGDDRRLVERPDIS